MLKNKNRIRALIPYRSDHIPLNGMGALIMELDRMFDLERSQVVPVDRIGTFIQPCENLIFIIKRWKTVREFATSLRSSNFHSIHPKFYLKGFLRHNLH